MWQKVRAWWKTEGEMVTLRGLDDRLLADMGLAREGLRSRITAKTEPMVETACGCRPAAQLAKG